MKTGRQQRDRPRSTGSVILSNAVANLALPLISILTGPLLARVLGVEGRGEVAAVVAPLLLVTSLSCLGLPDALVYFLARRQISVRAAVRVSIESSAVLGLMAIGVTWVAAPLLLRDAPNSVLLLRVLALSLPLLVMAVSLRCIVQGTERFGAMVSERLILAAGRLVSLVVLAVAGLLTVVTATAASVLMPLVAAVPLVLALRRPRPRDRRSSGADPEPAAAGASLGDVNDPPLMGTSHDAVALVAEVEEQRSRRATPRRLVFGYGLRSGVGNVASHLLQRLDQVLLAPLAGVSQLGLYVVAVALAEIPTFALHAVRDVIYATSASRDDPRLVARATRCVILLAVPTVVLGVLATPVLLPLLFGEEFNAAIPLAQLALLAFSFEAVRLLLGTGLLAIGRPGLRSAIQVGGSIITVAALLLLVPPLGALGAALAMLGTRTVLAVASQIAFTRLSGVSVRDCVVPQRKDIQDVWQLLSGVLRRTRKTSAAA